MRLSLNRSQTVGSNIPKEPKVDLKCPSKDEWRDSPGGPGVKEPSTMLGTRVRSWVQEDPTCSVATKAVRHNY